MLSKAVPVAGSGSVTPAAASQRAQSCGRWRECSRCCPAQRKPSGPIRPGAQTGTVAIGTSACTARPGSGASSATAITASKRPGTSSSGSELVMSVTSSSGCRALTVGAYALFASRWLIPRWGRLQRGISQRLANSA
jgi:hypothetical protein